MPISKIKVGDMFRDPYNGGPIYVVEEINIEEKLIKVQAFYSRTLKPIKTPFWERSSDRMFSEDWRWNP